MIRSKVNLEIKDHMGCSAIVYGKMFSLINSFNTLFCRLAAMFGNNIVVRELIVAGANLNSATNDGKTALMFGKVL